MVSDTPGKSAAPRIAVALLVGCGGDDTEAKEEERGRLEDALGFLVDDLGLTADQVECTARTVEEDLGGEDLDRFAEQVRQVDSGEISVEDLSEADTVILTGAVATCAADS